MSTLDVRLALLRNSYLPIPAKGKATHINGWSTKTATNEAEIRLQARMFRDHTNTGILTKFTPAVDIDITLLPAAEAVEALAREVFEERGHLMVRIGQAPKRAILLRTDEPFDKLTAAFTAPDGIQHKIEILGAGQQVIVGGIHQDTGKPYTWHGGTPMTVPRDDLPYARREDVIAFLDKASAMLVEQFGFQPSGGVGSADAKVPMPPAEWPSDIDQPSWLDGRSTGVIVAVNNGLLEVESQQLFRHTPQFFNQTAVPFDYRKDAPYCTRWLGFLKQLWPKEPAAIEILAEWFGYVISGRLDLHKILLMVGPTRGGKGVIARVLTSLLGKQNVCGPTLNSLGGDFGLAPLLGKPLAIISDARFVGKNGNVVVERLLSISGEDTLTVNRKYRDQWNGKLPCRLHVISNELPRLGDASTAIVGRIILLLLSNSWLGKEDHGLESELQSELPGILNWGLTGLHRLTVKNGNRFTHAASADEAITTMRDLASPVAAFVREQCEIGPDLSVPVDGIYAAYKIWAEGNGHPKLAKHIFGRDLRAAVPRIWVKRPRNHDVRVQHYVGIGMCGPGQGSNLNYG